MIYLLNGINDSIATTTGALVAPLRAMGHDVQHLMRPTSRVWSSRSKRYLETTAKRLIYQMSFNETPRMIVAHSQGCLQAWVMMQLHGALNPGRALFDRIYMIDAAMNRGGWDWERLEFEKMKIIYNPDDLAIWAGALLPFHRFGLAGARGFRTNDKRIIQRSDSMGKDGVLGHNHYFRDDHVMETARDIADFYLE
jgi:pimeloyl-ACP methyl ester carboxylesterase